MSNSQGKGQQEFLIVASQSSPEGREATYSLLNSRLQSSKLILSSSILEVPKNLKFGTLNDLLLLGDECVKHDLLLEQICRRLEKLALEVDPSAELQILWQRNTYSDEQYIYRFIWDEAKCPTSRSLKQNVNYLVTGATKLDEEIRVKSALFNEIKTGTANAAKGASTPLQTRDLTDVLTPTICTESDFIDTEHLVTLLAVVPKTEIQNFENSYWRWNERIVPGSHKRFDVTDREGSTVYSFIAFKNVIEAIRAKAKPSRIIIREFRYSEELYKLKQEEREKMESEKAKQETILTRICLAAFSDCFIAWTHIKVIRVFIECVLRFGVPPNFDAFVLKLNRKAKESKLRKELEDILCSKTTIGRSYFTNAATGGDAGDEGDNDDSFYPYVSFSMIPFQLFVQK